MAPRFTFAVFFCAAMLLVGCKTTSSGVVYRIKIEAGDTLAAVAMKYDTTWDKIAALNGLERGAPVKVGTVLKIQPGPGGLVAGAEPVRASRTPRTARSTSRGGNVAPASPDEFTEADIPTDDANAASDGRKSSGLFFGNSSGRSPLSWPLQGDLSSRYGTRGGKLHKGIDIRSPRHSPIVAAGKGVVEFAGTQHGYGRVVIVNHGTYKTLYAHMTKIKVLRGERVDTRTVVGTVGTSGNASGPHLHFEVRNTQDQNLDPLSVLKEDELLSSRR